MKKRASNLISGAPRHALDEETVAKWKQTKEALRASEARYRALFEYAPDGIVIADMHAYYLDANASMCRMIGYSRSELIGLNASDIVAATEVEHIKPALNLIRARLDYRREWQFRRRDASVFGADVMASLMPDGNLLAMIRDNTERKRTETELRSAEAQLRALVGRLHNVREEEARRIARELHDDLGQHLTAFNMELADLEMKQAGVNPQQREHFTRMHAGVDHMIEIVQQISGELRLAQLDVLGLSAAIDWQAKEFSRRSAIPCRITRLDEIRHLSDAQNTALFRILQEALTNIARHAGATEVEISLEARPDQTALRVHDNGRGIAAAEVRDPASIGLIGMRERVRLVGGEILITGGAGVGTTVLVRMPLQPTGESSA
jgi:PAS domain S-box-containing protein